VRVPSTRGKRVVGGVVVAAVVLGTLYLGWALLLFAGSTEGDVPDVSRLALPVGSEVVSETRDCASGGCWIDVVVRPPDGQSPEDLAVELGAAPQLQLRGNIVDPRTVWVWAEPGVDELKLRADYWSRRYVP
jgi:hypothetical protein